MDIKGIYFGHEEDQPNTLYRVNHHKPKIKAGILINGALMDQSQKNLRTTLDFKEGSGGSQGNEEEYAVPLNDSVLNISVPAPLSREDDIAGSHVASSGETDAGLLFYLGNRGIDHKLAEDLIVEPKYTSTTDLLKD